MSAIEDELGRNLKNVLFACALLVLSAVGGCGPMQPEHTVSRCAIGNGSIEVRYLEIIGPSAFASHTIRFYFVENGRDRLLGETQLKNDGKKPNIHNVDFIENRDNTISIALHGEEQQDSHWKIKVHSGIVTIENSGRPEE